MDAVAHKLLEKTEVVKVWSGVNEINHTEVQGIMVAEAQKEQNGDEYEDVGIEVEVKKA